MEGSIVRDTLGRPSDGRMGLGVLVQRPGDLLEAHATGTVRASLIERNRDWGLGVTGAEATVETTLVRNTLPRDYDGGFGDGIALTTLWFGSNNTFPARLDLTGVQIETSARAGVGNFSGHVSLANSKVACNAIDLACELLEENLAWQFEDLGGNDCSCGDETTPCKVLTNGIAPPEAM